MLPSQLQILPSQILVSKIMHPMCIVVMPSNACRKLSTYSVKAARLNIKNRLQVHVFFRLPHKIVINGGIQNYFATHSFRIVSYISKFLCIFNTDSRLFIAKHMRYIYLAFIFLSCRFFSKYHEHVVTTSNCLTVYLASFCKIWWNLYDVILDCTFCI